MLFCVWAPDADWSLLFPLLYMVNSASLGDLCLVSCFCMIMHLPRELDKALGAADYQPILAPDKAGRVGAC